MLASATRASDAATAVTDDTPASPAQVVDEYDQDSFPASDAPSQWAGGAVPQSRDGKSRRIVNPPTALRPLEGVCVLVCRPRDQPVALTRRLELLGADVVCTPAMRTDAPADPAPLRAAAAALAAGAIDWLVATSPNAVAALWRDAPASLTAALPWLRVAAVGPVTADALRARGVAGVVVPERHTSSALADLLTTVYGPASVLLPRSSLASPTLPTALRAAGWTVHAVEAYRPEPVERVEPDAAARLASAVVDVAVFTCPPAVRRAAALDGPLTCRVATIGPATTAACRDAKVAVHAEADSTDLDALTDAVIRAARR